MRTEVLECVKFLRRNETESEKIFWNVVRNRKVKNKKFVRQQAFIFDYENEKRFFVADFYCAERKLIVEIDGKIHDSQKEKDLLRTEILGMLGLRVVRFSNRQVLKNIGGTITHLEAFLQ
jgi:very-short-patch-repair endonuclease